MLSCVTHPSHFTENHVKCSYLQIFSDNNTLPCVRGQILENGFNSLSPSITFMVSDIPEASED